MDETEWLSAVEIGPSSLGRLPQRPSDRQLRLFAVACCERAWHLFSYDHRLCSGLRTALGLAEDCVSNIDRRTARRQAHVATTDSRANRSAWAVFFTLHESAWMAAISSCEEVCRAIQNEAVEQSQRAVSPSTNEMAAGARRAESVAQMRLLRDIVGNPFRPVAFDPAWRTPTVAALASAIYADRAFDRLPILADALEEAGCDHPDVLAHCRGDGPHVRGCWVVDLALGKS